MSTSKMQFPQGTEVGIAQEEGNADIAYAVLGGLSVSLTKLEDGRLYVNIEAVDDTPFEAVVVQDGDTELATVRYE